MLLKAETVRHEHKIGNMEAMVCIPPNPHRIKTAFSSRAVAVLPGVFVFFTQSAAFGADIDKWQSFQKNGEEAFDNHRWRRAENYFAKAVREADRTDVGDQKLALSLRKLAEANISARKYKEAEAHLQRAIKVAHDCGGDDRESIRDLLELAKTYRSVNLEQFGQNVATVLKETGLDGIEILNTKDGNSRVVVKFADKFNKHINSADINEVNVEKKLTFDIHEAKDGTITLSNIKGLRVRSKVWVNLTDTSIDPNGEEGKTTAMVTAEKLGLTKTMKTVLPKPVYDKIFNVVQRIRHPELHSPWHKQLQEKIGATNKPKPVPITVTDASKDAGKDASQDADKNAAKNGEQNNSAATNSQATVPKVDPAPTVDKEVTGVRQFAAGAAPAAKSETSSDVNSVKN